MKGYLKNKDGSLIEIVDAKAREDLGTLKADLSQFDKRILKLESDGSKGISTESANLLCDILSEALFGSIQTDAISRLRELLTSEQPEPTPQNPVSVSWSGTTATINNLKSTAITWSGTKATIGA